MQENERKYTSRMIDVLFNSVKRYRSMENFRDLLKFCNKFPTFSPYNAMLINLQKPGAKYLLTAEDWKFMFHREPKPDATPIVILIPFGPVNFLYDIDDVQKTDDIYRDEDTIFKELTNEVQVKGDPEWDKVMCVKDNLPYFGIKYERRLHAASSVQGKITRLDSQADVEFPFKDKMFSFKTTLPYYLNINSFLSDKEEVPILFHELGHFFCHHLPPKTRDWWTYREDLDERAKEFEAETVSYIVCGRLGLEGDRFLHYLSQNLSPDGEIPHGVSVDMILMAADSIEDMMEMLYPRDWPIYKYDEAVKNKVDDLKDHYPLSGTDIPATILARRKAQNAKKQQKEKERDIMEGRRRRILSGMY